MRVGDPQTMVEEVRHRAVAHLPRQIPRGDLHQLPVTGLGQSGDGLFVRVGGSDEVIVGAGGEVHLLEFVGEGVELGDQVGELWW